MEQRYFGRVKKMNWREAQAGTQQLSLIKAALMQHEIAFHVHHVRESRAAAGHRGWTFVEVAESRMRSVDYHGLMRLLRGDVPMGLHHMMELGGIFAFATLTPWDNRGTDQRGNNRAVGRPIRR